MILSSVGWGASQRIPIIQHVRVDVLKVTWWCGRPYVHEVKQLLHTMVIIWLDNVLMEFSVDSQRGFSKGTKWKLKFHLWAFWAIWPFSNKVICLFVCSGKPNTQITTKKIWNVPLISQVCCSFPGWNQNTFIPLSSRATWSHLDGGAWGLVRSPPVVSRHTHAH